MTASKAVKKEKRKCRCGSYLDYPDEKASGKCSFCAMDKTNRPLLKGGHSYEETESEKEEDDGEDFKEKKPKPKKAKRKSAF